MLYLDGRGSLQGTGGVQGMGSILGEAQADRECNRDSFARVTSKRQERKSLGRRATREIGTVTKLDAFERFVFVLSILERYSKWDCSLLLGCTVNRVAEARMNALRRLPDLAALFPRGDGLPMRRLRVTA